MAILKYTDADGNLVTVNSYKVNNVTVTQEAGDSEADVMSQKAVTQLAGELQAGINQAGAKAEENSQLIEMLADTVEANKIYCQAAANASNAQIAKKANSADVYTKDEADEKFLTEHQDLGDYALQSEVDKKANKSDVYTKTEIDGKLSDIAADISEINNTLGECASTDDVGELANQLSAKANKSDVYTKAETDSLLSAKADKSSTYTKTEVDSLLDELAIDAGEYN